MTVWIEGCGEGAVVPTIKQAGQDCRQGAAHIVALTMTSVKVHYTDHPEFGTEDFEFTGCTISQLVPFSEALLYAWGAPVPTIECPICTGRNIVNCSTCGGRGQVLPSEVTSQQASASPTLDKYRDD